jgi:hypothetical protein
MIEIVIIKTHRIMPVKYRFDLKKVVFSKIYTFFQLFVIYAGLMAHNVLVVCDIFLRPIKKNAKHFYGCKKCGGVRRGNGVAMT